MMSALSVHIVNLEFHTKFSVTYMIRPCKLILRPQAFSLFRFYTNEMLISKESFEHNFFFKITRTITCDKLAISHLKGLVKLK